MHIVYGWTGRFRNRWAGEGEGLAGTLIPERKREREREYEERLLLACASQHHQKLGEDQEASKLGRDALLMTGACESVFVPPRPAQQLFHPLGQVHITRAHTHTHTHTLHNPLMQISTIAPLCVYIDDVCPYL